MLSRKSIVFLLVLLANVGCGNRFLADRATNPVIEDYSREVSWPFGTTKYALFSTGATRRTIYIDYNRGVRDKNYQGPRVCSEPPPDAVEAYANALSAAFRAQAETAAAQGPKASSDISGEVARTFATSAAPMLYRSQGLQLLRDMQYHLCNMRLNGDITSNEYQDYLLYAMSMAHRLIEQEMPALCVAAARPSVVVSAVAPPLPQRATGSGTATPAGGQSGSSQAGSSQTGGTGNQTQQQPAQQQQVPAPSVSTITVSAETCARLNAADRRSEGQQRRMARPQP